MKAFFKGSRPGKKVKVGRREFDLPILYFRDDAFAIFYTADVEKVRTLLPSDKLNPVVMWGKRALLGVACFNYIDTSIGPYGEVGVVVPAVYSKRKPLKLIPSLRETKNPNFGMVVLHLPVTNMIARDGGRGIWGYTKFVSEMKFDITPEYMECRLSEKKKHILTVRVVRQGMMVRDKRPLSTFSVLDGKLIQTTIPQLGFARNCFFPKGSFLKLGDHQIAKELKKLNISKKPVLSRYYLERSGILPAGKVIEKNVGDLSGHKGENREGELIVEYLGK